MENLDLTQFNPTVAELQKAVDATKSITAVDLKDTAQLRIVKDSRINLRNMRVAISKKGKELREGAISFQKAVIEKERELIAIVEPEEERLSAIETEAAIIATREKRRDKLPWRKEQASVFSMVFTEDELLDIDDDAFNAMVVGWQAEKNAVEAERLAQQQRDIDAQKAKLARDEEIRVAKEKAVEEERQRAQKADIERREREERDRKDLEERTKREAAEKEARAQQEKERLEREEKERQEAEARKAREAQEKLEADKKYTKFKLAHGWTDATKTEFFEENSGGTITLWKKVGVFKI